MLIILENFIHKNRLKMLKYVFIFPKDFIKNGSALKTLLDNMKQDFFRI